MSEMFTEEDAENDGLIKREVGQQLNGVLSRKSGKLYTKFRDWCEKNDRDPAKVLGDCVLRAMKNEAYAQELSGTVIDLGALERNQIREDDLELVTQLIDKFDEADDSGGEDPIESLVEQRIQAIGSGPIGALNQQQQASGGGGSDTEVRRLEKKIDRLQSEVTTGDSSSSDSGQVNHQTSKQDEKNVDDLFGEGEEMGGDGTASEGGQEEEVVADNPDSDSSGDVNEDGVADDSDGTGDGGGDSQGDAEEVEVVDLGAGESSQGMQAEPNNPFSSEEADKE